MALLGFTLDLNVFSAEGMKHLSAWDNRFIIILGNIIIYVYLWGLSLEFSL